MDREFARLTLPASTGSLPAFLAFARAGARSAGLAAGDLDNLDLVLEELLVNVARYAYQPETGDVEVAYAIDKPGTLLLEISDKGHLFNPLDKALPDLSGGLEERAIGGLGIFLVRHLAGCLTYRREQGRNTISFRFPPDAGTGR